MGRLGVVDLDGEAIKVEDLEPGMMVDLEKDPYADPLGDDVGFPYEFATVESVEQETADVILVYFDTSTVGFPKGHRLYVPNAKTFAKGVE